MESVAQPTPEATADSLPVVSMPEAITPQLGYIDDVVEIGDSIFNVSHMDQSARLAFVASRSGEVPGTVSDDEGYVEVTKQTAETGEVLQLEELDNELPDESMHKPIDQTSVFSGVELTPTLTPKKSKKHTIPWRSTAVAASAVSRVMPKTRKMRTVAAVAAATLTVGGGVTWAATNDARESLIAECVDESYAGDTIASTTLDAQSSIEWSLMNRDDSPVMRVGEDGKQLPKLTVEGVSVDLEICAVDGKSVSESDGTVSTDASNLVARAVINSNEAASNWQSIDRSLLENAAKSEILSSREAAGYISSMGDKNNVTKATGVTTNELAIQIESDKVMLDKDTSVNAVLIDLAVKGLKQRVAQGERELLINGDVDGVALDFTNATEDQGTQINFDETGTKIDISKSKVTKLHLEDVEEKKEK